MIGHGDPRRLPDEIFAGRYAPEFIPPVGAMYFVCLNVAPPADPETIEPRTIVRSYPYWRLSRNGKYLERLPQVDTLSVPAVLKRGSIPSEFAPSSARYVQLRESWRMRAVEARAKLRLRVAGGGASFLESFSEPPRIEAELARYQEERLHPSELPESVMANLINTPFLPVIGMARVECTGQLTYCDKHNGMLIDSDDPEPGCDVYTWCRRTAGWDDSVNGVVAHEAEERALAVQGAYANGYEPIDCRLGNAEYDAYRAAWEQAQERHRAKS